MRGEIDRAYWASRGLTMEAWRAQTNCVLETKTTLSVLRDRGDDFLPKFNGLDSLGKAQFATLGFLLIGQIPLFEFAASAILEVAGFVGIEQSPGSRLARSLHEEVRHPWPFPIERVQKVAAPWLDPQTG